MKEILLNFLALLLTALTPDGGEVPPEMQSEIDSLKEAIGALDGGGEGQPPVDNAEVTNSLLQRMTDLAANVKNVAVKTAVIDKLTEAKFIALNAAIKVFDKAQKEFGNMKVVPKNNDLGALIKNNGKFKAMNVNDANFRIIKNDEFSMSYVLRQTGLLMGLKEMTLTGGENLISWNEGVRGANGAAIVAIGAAKPVKVNTTSYSTLGMTTLAEQNTVSVQLLKAINGVETIYKDDLEGDLQDKIALQVAAVIAAAANPITTTVPINQGTANIADVIEAAYWQLKPYANGNRIAIAISSQQRKSLVTLRDTIGRRLDPVAYPDLDVVDFISSVTYDDDTIFGWVENLSIRFYNDGLWVGSDELNGRGVSGDNFSKNQITLMAEYLNEGIVIRSTDVVTTIYDSIAAVIEELTP